MTKIWIYPLALLGVLLALTSSCKKDESPQSSKKEPIITWANPADISFGTLLSASQLNATADVPGTFVYTPAIGTKLNVGANQNLKVDFSPTDAATYNTANKTVKINVIISTTVTDIDGNVYHTISIGTQVWMVENLKTTKYRNGDPIPNVTDGSTWLNNTTGAYCNYDNVLNNATLCGRLYNWYSVNDTRNICPSGWHVSTDAEWTVLTTFLGGENIAGGKLKETGNTHWQNPNTGATNESGFTALPGGYRLGNGSFYDIGNYSSWWSSSEYSTFFAWFRYVRFDAGIIGIQYDAKISGNSVRCVED